MKRAWMLSLPGYIGVIFAANWAITHFGVVPVGFGLMAPAAVYFVGLSFTLRDLVQESLGRNVVLGAVLVGAGCSAFVSPGIALASGVAFGVSELADLAVYTPLRKRNWHGAVLLSNSIGIVLDSVLFLWLAFHSLDFLPGQLVGKSLIMGVTVALLSPIRRTQVAR